MTDSRPIEAWLYELQAPGRAFTAEEIHLLRDLLALRRRTAREWAQDIGSKSHGNEPTSPPPDSVPVTQDEVVLTYLVGLNDLFCESRATQQDMSSRLTRMELVFRTLVPDYDTRAMPTPPAPVIDDRWPTAEETPATCPGCGIGWDSDDLRRPRGRPLPWWRCSECGAEWDELVRKANERRVK